VYTRKKFNAPVHPREAMELREPTAAKIYFDPAELASRLSALPAGTRIGYTNGCFDLFHAGHAALLDFARAQCDFLVAFVNTDESVYDLKGVYPVLNTAERAGVLAAVGSVGAVIAFNENTPRATFEKVGRCDVLVKGADYEGYTLAGHEFAERCAIAPQVFAVHSSDIAKRIRVSGRGV
jgi:D-beta-D-heptose 7-phosphate kinase/D-beta-D-heptose 1-phosphate adenosyltransferase